MLKHRLATLLIIFILGGIILSLSCSLPFQLSVISNKSVGDQPVNSMNKAVEIVITEVIKLEELDHSLIMFALSNPLQPGDELGPFYKDGYEPYKAPTQVSEDAWFFWIDDAPGARFMHSTRFVLITKDHGQITVSTEMWWPVLNGNGLWTTPDDYWDESNWVFSNQVFRPNEHSLISTSHLSSTVARGHNEDGKSGAAIVINGWRKGESLEDDLATDGNGMHDALENSGFDVTYYGPKEDKNPDRDGEITTTNREQWFRKKAEELEPGDTLVVYFNGHGGETDDGIGGIGSVYEDTLKKALERFDPDVNIIVVIDGCKSGQFRDSLRPVADITITSTNNVDNAYGDLDTWIDGEGVDDPNPDDEGGEFSSGFIEGWNKITGDEAKKEEARQRAKKYGTSFWEEIAAMSFVYALKLDAGYLAGLSFPMVERGGPKNKPTPEKTPMVTTTPEPTPTASSQDILGDYRISMIVKKDQAGHKSFIGMPGNTTLIIKAGSIIIEGPFPWVAVSGKLNPDGSFDTSGRGTVAGFANIKITFQGSVIGGRLEGDYIMGANGGLPGGKSITYGVSGEQEGAKETNTPAPIMAGLQEFANSYNTNFQAADVDGLLGLLHPAVLERYGSSACQEYISTVVETPIQIQVLQVQSFEPWTWEIDGQSTLIKDVYTILANITAEGQADQVTMHVGLTEDGTIAWFTDCGEPLP